MLTSYQIISLLGIPSLFTVCGWIYKKLKRNQDEIQVMKLGLQALLRGQMISDYNFWSDKGYAPIYAKESFENCWKQYHGLGVNGVMDDMYEKFLKLPTKLTKKTNNNN